jgi:hypothetical protein
MDFELVSEAEYASLPEEPEDKFVALESICRRNMYKILDDNTNGNLFNLVRLQYMVTISVAAEEIGIEGFAFPAYKDELDYAEFYGFHPQGQRGGSKDPNTEVGAGQCSLRPIGERDPWAD